MNFNKTALFFNNFLLSGSRGNDDILKEKNIVRSS